MTIHQYLKNTFIIAEAGVNHNGSFQLAKDLIDVAVTAGADAVKFQTFRAEDLVSVSAPKADYQKRTTDVDESQYKMLKALELSDAEQVELSSYCKEKNILFMSSPFDIRSVDFLDQKIQVPIIKIPSGEITNFPLLLKIAQTNKPVILSTGMSLLGEIEAALGVLAFGYLNQSGEFYPSRHKCTEAYFSQSGQSILKDKVSLLHCTSEYPAPFDQINLRVIATLQSCFNLPVGYSDHTTGIPVSIAAVACGAQIIEKHFTLDKNMAGPDHLASLDPVELTALVTAIRQVELALGHSKKVPAQSELTTRAVARKSLVSLQKIRQGELFTEINLGCKRPGTGVSSQHVWDFHGKCAERDYEQDELIGV